MTSVVQLRVPDALLETGNKSNGVNKRVEEMAWDASTASE